jgi:hypothetical protein
LTFRLPMKIQIIPRTQKSSLAPLVFHPVTRVQIAQRPLRILDFDIENRPLSYLGSDFTTGEVTAISWAWTDQPKDVTVYLLGETDLPDILAAFVAVYNQADMVTGHYIIGHDLPMLNGALMEYQMPALGDKLVHDTKVHLIRRKGISCSQESLGAMLRLDHAKVVMNQSKWRAANRLTPEGLKLVRERVTGDVIQHIAMRRELDALGYLSGPKMWRSGTAKSVEYTP